MMLSRARPSLRLAAPLVALLLLACTSEEPAPPADADELRDRVWTALRGDGDEVLHLEFLIPVVGGDYEVIGEMWVDWHTDSIRRTSFGRGSDEAPLTLVVGDLQYYPPSLDGFPLSVELDGRLLDSSD